MADKAYPFKDTGEARDSGDTGRQAPVYVRIAEVLRKAIRERHIEAGAVILEGPVADILQSTRTPVRQALRELEAQGLIGRFDGRGYVAGAPGTQPRRVALTPAMFGVEGEVHPVRKALGWEALYDEVERNVVHFSVFGRYRVNEIELARHFGVGRLVARDVLLRMESLGLLEKDQRLRWVVTPLDAARINHLYELRWLLEPVALRAAVLAGPPGEVASMAAELKEAMRAYPKVAPTTLDKLEYDLHVGLLSRCANKDLLQSLQRTRCILTLSKHVLGVSAPMPRRDPFMAEHLGVVAAIVGGQVELAQAKLRTHLEASCLKVIRRAEVVRRSYAKPKLPYIADH
jgi:DNA-binding GntR family transcriptional regulator